MANVCLTEYSVFGIYVLFCVEPFLIHQSESFFFCGRLKKLEKNRSFSTSIEGEVDREWFVRVKGVDKFFKLAQKWFL